MTTPTKLKKHHFSVAKKLKVLKLHEIGFPTAYICLDYKIHKTTLYRWIKQHGSNQVSGLNRKPKARFIHPQKTKQAVSQQVIDFSIARPNLGCCRVAEELRKLGHKISSPTIQRILIESRLGKVEDRVYALEKKHVKEGWTIDSDIIALISRFNPCFKHYKEIGSYPGEILVQDTFPIFNFFQNTYIYVVIDTYSFYSFAYPFKDKTADKAIDVLSSKAIMYFKQNNFDVKKVLTSRGREFTQFNNQYTTFLNQRKITHELYTGKSKNWHGYIEKYKRDFIKILNETPIDESDLSFMKEFISKIVNDKKNANRKVSGFPNFGASPATVVRHFQSKV